MRKVPHFEWIISTVAYLLRPTKGILINYAGNYVSILDTLETIYPRQFKTFLRITLILLFIRQVPEAFMQQSNAIYPPPPPPPSLDNIAVL